MGPKERSGKRRFVTAVRVAVLSVKGRAGFRAARQVNRFGAEAGVKPSGHVIAGVLLLLVVGGVVFRNIRSGNTGETTVDSGHSSASIRKASGRGEGKQTRSARRDDRSGVERIRAAMTAGLSDPGMLEEALAACRRLSSTEEIEKLLSDPDYGWPPLSGGDGEGSDQSSFTLLYRGLLERWGEWDLDGAIARIGKLKPSPGGDFDEWLGSAGWPFKGAAKSDGEYALQRLREWAVGGGPFQEIAIDPLMEGWASTAPDQAWETLAGLRSDDEMLRGAVAGFFRGLPEHRIDDIRKMVDSYDHGGSPGRLDPASHVRRKFAETWLRADPAGALAWYEPHAEDLLFNRSNIDAILDGTRQARVYAELVGGWMATDFDQASAWLPSWQPQAISRDEVFQRIAGDESLPEGVRERAGELILEP